MAMPAGRCHKMSDGCPTGHFCSLAPATGKRGDQRQEASTSFEVCPRCVNRRVDAQIDTMVNKTPPHKDYGLCGGGLLGMLGARRRRQ